MKFNVTEQEFKTYVTGVLSSYFGVKPEDASKAQIYRATCMVVRDLLTNKRVDFKKVCHEQNAKQVYYMSMEFLLGRSLRNHLFNMGITEQVTNHNVIPANFGFFNKELSRFSALSETNEEVVSILEETCVMLETQTNSPAMNVRMYVKPSVNC